MIMKLFPELTPGSIMRTLLVLTILSLPAAVHAALSCEATPGDDGSVSTSGTPGALLYYQPTASVSAGSTSISLSSTAGLAAGDLVLVIQMQAAGLNSTNSDSYGDGTAGTPASGWLNNSDFTVGYYEYAAVASAGGGTLTLTSALTHSYTRSAASGTIGQKRYQVIRVPQYNNLTLIGNLTAPGWNGETGGVLPLDVAGTLNFNGFTINMQGRGFRGGRGRVLTGGAGGSNADFRSNATNNFHGSKGEGFAGMPRYMYSAAAGVVDTTIEGYPNGSYAMGAPANAGGGGTDGRPSNNDENSGGGGGGNGGAGGRGGNSWNSNLAVGGFGGAAFAAFAAPNRIVMGGGGGAATSNNGSTTPPHGGAGGGIVLIRTNAITGNGTINVNGDNGTTPSPANDGGGGGGAGGTAIVIANSQTGSLTINAIGGGGGNADPGGAAHGPGGGGGGGIVFTNPEISPTTNIAQGPSGYTVTPGNYFGASPSGGNVGNGVPDTDPDDIDGVSPGTDCAVNADLSITKVRSSSVLQAGSPATFELTVSNAGPDATTAPIVVTDVLASQFTYSSFSGTGWSCAESPAQTVTCTHNGPLSSGASLPTLSLNINVVTSPVSSSVSNTATVAFNNSGSGSTPNLDNNNANNSSTINETIYGVAISGNKRLYTYPTSASAGTAQRVVPGTNLTQTIGENSVMDLDLNPALAGNLTFSGNISVYLCLRREGSGNPNSSRSVTVSLRRADNNAVVAGPSGTQTFTGTGWTWYPFTITHTGPSTITSAQNLRLQVDNDSTGAGTRTVGITSNGGGGNCSGTPYVGGPSVSHAIINASTVINVSNVTIYNAASPGGSAVTATLPGTTVYVRSTITDPFGFADINNDTTLDILNAGYTLVSGPHNDTAILSSSGNTKVFEYAVTAPASIGNYIFRVRGNEGTEGTISHYNASGLTVINPPDLSVTKVANQSSASPSEDITYTVLVANNNVLGTGDAINVVAEDTLPNFTSFKIGSLVFTDGPSPYPPSTLTVGSIEFFDSNGSYAPVSGGGGAPAGYDGNVTGFRILFTGSMPQGGAFRLNYVLKVN